jgi:hypothetical protein
MKSDEYLWVEKYRPRTIDECILPKELKNTFNELVRGGQLPNLLLAGTAGLGKTTVAKALCNMLGLDFILINGSEESGIDVLRNKIKQFASTVSLSGGYKVVILDEADYLNCLDENEKILLTDGSLLSLKDMQEGIEYDVTSFNQETNQFEDDKATFLQSKDDLIYEIITVDGRTIKCTDKHPLIVKKIGNNKTEVRTIAEGLDGYEIVVK